VFTEKGLQINVHNGSLFSTKYRAYIRKIFVDTGHSTMEELGLGISLRGAAAASRRWSLPNTGWYYVSYVTLLVTLQVTATLGTPALPHLATLQEMSSSIISNKEKKRKDQQQKKRERKKRRGTERGI
jgi:hypothetical protein